MTIETLSIILKILTYLLMLSISIIGFFLVPFFLSVNKLTIAVTKLETLFKAQENGCIATHQAITKRMENFEKDNTEFSKTIEVLKFKTQKD